MIVVKSKRHCYQCGKTYHRVNKIDVWLLRNPGHRLGWRKEEQRVCLTCMSVKDVYKVLDVIDVKFERRLKVA